MKSAGLVLLVWTLIMVVLFVARLAGVLMEGFIEGNMP